MRYDHASEVRRENDGYVRVHCTVRGVLFRWTVRYRWTLMQRTTQRVLLSGQWASVRSDDSVGSFGCEGREVNTVALRREARAGIGAQLAHMVADWSERTFVQLLDCEGRCGVGYEAALAGRFAEAERHFRAAVERYTPGSRDGAAAIAFHNLSACVALRGWHIEAAALLQRARQADPGNREFDDRGSAMSDRDRQLRGMRTRLAHLP